MTKRSRSLMAACSGLLALAFAAPGLAAYQPQLTVQQSNYKPGAATTVGIVVAADPNDDPTAHVSIFSPEGYASNLGQAPGAAIGKAFLVLQSSELPGGFVPVSGSIAAGNPAAFQTESQTCTGSPVSQHVWALTASVEGQALELHVFVNTVGPYVVQQICPPPPQSLPFHAKLFIANLTIKGVFTNPAASNGYQWAADFTPYAGTVPNPAGIVEYRSYVGLPSSLTFKRAKSKASLVTFTGKLSVAGLSPAGIKLDLYQSPKPQPAPNFSLATLAGLLGSAPKNPVRTRALKKTGKYSITRKRPKGKKRTIFQMRFEDYLLSGPAGEHCLGASPSGLAIPCVGTTLAPLTSNPIAVAPRRKR
jgi:hypothetical protein